VLTCSRSSAEISNEIVAPMKFIVGLKLFSLPVMLSIVTREPDMLLAKLDILEVQWAAVEAEDNEERGSVLGDLWKESKSITRV